MRAARKTLSAPALAPGLQGSVSGTKVRLSSLIGALPGGCRQTSSSTSGSSPFNSRNVRCGCGRPRSAPVDAAGARRTAAAHKQKQGPAAGRRRPVHPSARNGALSPPPATTISRHANSHRRDRGRAPAAQLSTPRKVVSVVPPSVAVAWPARPACVLPPKGVPHPHTRTENRKGEPVGGEANGTRWTRTLPPPLPLADRLWQNRRGPPRTTADPPPWDVQRGNPKKGECKRGAPPQPPPSPPSPPPPPHRRPHPTAARSRTDSRPETLRTQLKPSLATSVMPRWARAPEHTGSPRPGRRAPSSLPPPPPSPSHAQVHSVSDEHDHRLVAEVAATRGHANRDA